VYDTHPRGMRSAREAVAAYYADHGAKVDPDALVPTTSTSRVWVTQLILLENFQLSQDVQDMHAESFNPG
jgi:hypothetical protein